MELDDLLKGEGLDATDIEDALAWARERAEQLVRGVEADPELGPLLGGALAVDATSTAVVPVPVDRSQSPSSAVTPSSDAGRFSLDSDPAVAASDGPPPLEARAPGEVTMPASGDGPAAQSAERESSVAADATGAETEEPSLDPLAGIDFDDLPGLDDDELPEEPAAVTRSGAAAETIERDNTVVPIEREPELTDPEMTLPDITQSLDAGQLRSEITEHAANPLLKASAEDQTGVHGGGLDDVDVTQRAANPLEEPETSSEPSAEDEEIEEIEEFELLDDDDVELVDDDAAAAAAGAESVDGAVPEWQAALSSAQVGGGDHAAPHSGEPRSSEVASAPPDGRDVPQSAGGDAESAASSDRDADDDEPS